MVCTGFFNKYVVDVVVKCKTTMPELFVWSNSTFTFVVVIKKFFGHVQLVRFIVVKFMVILNC